MNFTPAHSAGFFVMGSITETQQDVTRLTSAQIIFSPDSPPLVTHHGQIGASAMELYAIATLSHIPLQLAKSLSRSIIDHRKPPEALPFFKKIALEHPEINTILREVFMPNGLLNIDGLRQRGVNGGGNPYNLTLEAIQEFVLARVGLFYELTNYSLNSTDKYGFNSHGPVHIGAVAHEAGQILRQAGYGDNEQKRAVIAGILHDTGNVFSRSYHEIISVLIAQSLIPELQNDPDQWEIIQQAVLLHNEPSLSVFFSSQENPAILPSQRINALKKLPPEVLAVIIADKKDIRRNRTTTKAGVGLGALGENQKSEVDWHLFANAPISLSSFDLESVRGGNVKPTWTLFFQPGLSEQEQEEYGRFCTPEKLNIFFPAALHKMHREQGISHFSSWYGMFWQLYLERIMLAVEATMALYPQVLNVDIEVVDIDADAPSHLERRIQTINRENIDQFEALMRKKHFPKNKRN